MILFVGIFAIVSVLFAIAYTALKGAGMTSRMEEKMDDNTDEQ